MKYALATFFVFFGIAYGCEVHLPHQFIIFGNFPDQNSNIQSAGCNENVVNDLRSVIQNLDGRVASFQLKEMMSLKGHELEISPQSILIHQLHTLIREQLHLPSGVQVRATRSLNGASLLALPAGDKVEISCNNCLYGTQQPLNITIIGFDGTRQSLLASADFKKMVKAFRLITPLASFSQVDGSNVLKEEYIESIPHTDLITDASTLKFYRTNKPLKAGDLLKRADLNAINLVKAGIKTDVVLENQMVRIKTQGISRSNGAIGEYVEVFHPQKNKKYHGKVIDINKVLVEL